jgi:hypothetical protein
MASVTLTATVDKHFSKGIRLAEKDGDYTRRWTIWTNERPAEGTTVSHRHRRTSACRHRPPKAAEYDGKHYVESVGQQRHIRVNADRLVTDPRTGTARRMGPAAVADHIRTTSND